MFKTDLLPRPGQLLLWLLPTFLLFAQQSLHAQCAPGQQQCPAPNIDFGIMMDESFVNSFAGPTQDDKVAQARYYAAKAVEFATTKLAATFSAAGLAVNFGIAHFPNFIVPDSQTPPQPAEENDFVQLQGYVINYWKSTAKICIKKDAVIIFSGKPYGFYGIVPKLSTGYGDICYFAPYNGGTDRGNHYALIRKTGPYESTGTTLAHEICHLMSIPHTDAQGSNCASQCSDCGLLMCANTCAGPNDTWTLTSCDISEARKLLCDDNDYDCQCLAPTGYYPPDYECPSPNKVYVEVDNKHPLINCGDRDLITIKVTVCNSNVPLSHKVRINLDGAKLEMVPNSGNFNQILTAADNLPYLQGAYQEWRIVDQNGSEIVHTFEANECKSFTIQARYLLPPVSNGVEYTNIQAYIDVHGGTTGNKYIQPVSLLAGSASGVSIVNDVYLPSGVPLYVTGKIKVDGPAPFSFSFANNKEIFFGPGGSELSIENPLTKIPATKLSGCTTMWKGVTVKSGSTLEVDESEFRDAQYGIRLQRGATALVTATKFADNNVGIYVDPVSSSGAGAVTLTANGNMFQCTPGQLKPAYPNQAPAPVSTGYAGIWANDLSGLAIQKDQDGYTNVFENLVMGIVALNTSFSIKDAAFKNMMPLINLPAGYAAANTGSGIYVENGSAHVDGQGIASNSPYSFDNCAQGIEAWYSSIYAKNNRMRNMDIGIRVDMASTNILDISYNNISAVSKGIECFQPGVLPNSSLISYNTINMDGSDLGTGIFLGGSNVPLSTPVRIQSNTVAMSRGLAGIRVVSAKGVDIFRNNVYTTKGGVCPYGISVKAGNQILGRCNTISGKPSGTVSPGSIDLHVAHSPGSTWACNRTSGGDIGLNFTGNCSGSAVRGNKMAEQAFGLFYGLPSGVDNVDVGVQQHQGNEFDNASLGVGAMYVGAQTLVAQNAYIVDMAENSDFFPANLFGPPGWFNDVPNEAPTAQCVNNDCPVWEFGNTNVREMERVATGNIFATHFEPTLKSEAQRYLYAYLREHGIPEGTSAILPAFLYPSGAPQYKTFGTLRYNLDQVYAIQPADGASLAANENDMGLQLGALSQVEWEMMAPGISEAQLQALKAQRAAILTNIGNTFAAWKSLQTALRNSQTGALAAVAGQNAALTAVSTWEMNEQTATDVFLSTVGAGIPKLNESQKSALALIAAQCPLEGGSAVYFSRAMLESLGGVRQLYNDNADCLAATLREDKAGRTSGVDRLRIVPNPGKGVFRVEYQLENALPGATFILFDLHGRELARHDLPVTQGEIVLNLTHLPDGTYFYCVPGSGHKTNSGKLVIAGN